MIKSTMPTKDGGKRMAIVDNNGTVIAVSSFDNKYMESFKNLQSFQNAKNGETGLLTEIVNGKNMSISYTPIKFAQTNWIAFLFHPMIESRLPPPSLLLYNNKSISAQQPFLPQRHPNLATEVLTSRIMFRSY
jgi:hypothetical protein